MVDIVIISQSRNCLLSVCTASYISESELSAVDWPFILTILESELSAVGCRLVLYIYVPTIPNWSLSCRLSSCTASYISESELVAVGLNSRLSLTIHQTMESELSADQICQQKLDYLSAVGLGYILE